jgi:hypothetical protein
LYIFSISKKKPRGCILEKQFLKGDHMNILTLPLLEAFVLLAKMTVIIVWMTIMLGFTVRVILGSILGELLDFHEKKTDVK